MDSDLDMANRLLYIILLSTISVSNHAQLFDEKQFRLFTIKDGLSDNYVTSIQQDEWGYLWVGTDVGLNRFDGYSFTKFSQGSATLPLLSGKIANLKRIDDHRLGIISRSGFQLLNTSNFTLQDFLIPDSTAFATYLNYPSDARKLSDGSFGLSTATGFYVFDKAGKVIFRHDAYYPKDVGKKRILYARDILAAGNAFYPVYLEEGRMGYFDIQKKIFREVNPVEDEWKIFYRPQDAETHHWISKYELNDHAFIFVNYEGNNIVYYDHRSKNAVASPLPFSSVAELNWQSRITRLNDSSFVIIGGNSGLYLFHLNDKGHITCNPQKFLSSYSITCIFLDQEKRLWLGTPEGLLQEKRSKPLISSYSIKPFSKEDSLAGRFTSAYRYKDKLYVGRYSRSTGLVILDAATMKLEKRVNFFGKDNMWNEVHSVQMYYPDTLWLGSNGGILWFDTKTGRYGDVLKEVKNIPGEIMDRMKYKPFEARNFRLEPPQKNGYAWFCCALQGIVGRYNIAARTFTFFTLKSVPPLPFDRVKRIIYDSYGGVWLGGHSLARWDNDSNNFDTLITVYGGNKKFNDDIVAISADATGSLWLHNEENGLLQYKIKQKKFAAFTSRDALPSDVFESFSPVINDNLWMASRTELTRFNVHTKKIIVYNQSDGLPEQNTSSHQIYYDSLAGCFYMVFNNDLAKIPLQKVEQNMGSKSDLLIQDLIVNNRHLFQPANGLRLKPGENNLSIRFTLIDFESPNYSFAYRLNNDGPWTILGRERNIVLSGLAPGSYAIQLKAMGKPGNEKLSAFSFFLAPPFWKTTWFKIMLGLSIALLLYYLYRNRINQIRKNANLDKLVAQTEMKALHAQMNPHFIFNCLNSIREMILNNENRQASHYLSKFAHLIRVTLNNSSKPFISLQGSVDYLRRYLEMERIRKSNFSYHIDIDESLEPEDLFLPPMLIQPFIENAIWHGGNDSNGTIDISIRFMHQNNQLVCIVEDNGIGIQASLKKKYEQEEIESDHHSLGIANVKQRIQVLNEKYNLHSHVTIEDKNNLAGKGTGTLVTLHLPIKNSEL